MPSLDLRPSPISGQWYPAEAKLLAESVDACLQAARLPALPGEVVGVMAPHAGLRYSGASAGHAFAAVRGLQPELAAVVAPLHYPSRQPFVTSAHQAYQTPLGPVPLDPEAVEALDAALRARLDMGLARVRQDPEHALEIELPFLQRALGGPFRLLPVMIHHPEPRFARALGEALAQALSGRRALLVASTDLSHFYPQAEAQVYDSHFLRQVEAMDPEGVLRADAEGLGYACGRAAVAAVLWAARLLGASQAHILHYSTSGEASGDTSRVVGYAAAAFTRP